MSEVSSDYATLIDGRLYWASPGFTGLLRPMLPLDDMIAELRTALHRGADGVEIVAIDAAAWRLVVDGVKYHRHKLYGRLEVPLAGSAPVPDKAWSEESCERWRAANVDQVRSGALSVSRLMAGRIVEQAIDLRARRSVDWDPKPGPRLEPIVVHMHQPMPVLLGDSYGEPLISIECNSDSVVAVFGAYYFVTPVGVEEPR